jgi:stage II sporulation protein D
MFRKLILIQILIVLISELSFGQVRVRLYANQTPESSVFTVNEGKYEVSDYKDKSLFIGKGEPVIISRFNGKVAVKSRNLKGILCDSVLIKGLTGNDNFSLRINGNAPVIQLYSGDLQCLSDLGTLLFINICDVENYIAGVVKTEGGSGKNLEYFKTQAVLARTYMYKYFDKHLIDRYNLCDNTHCQAFNGITHDTIIARAALGTKGLVVLDSDSTLVISAFHSNCGGETSAPEDVWLFNPPYLKKVVDPYCTSSRNATWQKSIAFPEWVSYLRRSGFTGNSSDPSVFNFSQIKRLPEYRAGSFTLPLRLIRTDFNLRSTFFSVFAEGDSVLLKGRGYGHGVGLCQEGAMVMAAKGFNFRQIIDFYYSGVIISDIKNAVVIENE